MSEVVMSEFGERCIADDYEIEGVEYEVWVDRWRNFTLVFGGHDQDLDQFSGPQLRNLRRFIDEKLAPGT
jgi:hypothetical protein